MRIPFGLLIATCVAEGGNSLCSDHRDVRWCRDNPHNHRVVAPPTDFGSVIANSLRRGTPILLRCIFNDKLFWVWTYQIREFLYAFKVSRIPSTARSSRQHR